VSPAKQYWRSTDGVNHDTSLFSLFLLELHLQDMLPAAVSLCYTISRLLACPSCKRTWAKVCASIPVSPFTRVVYVQQLLSAC
jgi:hypothetical protein